MGLGTLGIVLPILPTVPFYLLTVFCFARSSEKLHTWFINTKLYKNNLECYVQKKGMTIRTKFSIIFGVTLLMSVGFILMLSKEIYIPCIIMGIVWIGHIYYFGLKVETIKE